MSRPPSITLFERLYLASTALYVLNAALFWGQNRALLASLPQLRSNPQVAGLVSGIVLGSLVVTVLVSLLFWWLTARQRSEVGKWAVVVTEAIGALFALFALLRLAQGTASNTTGVVLGLISTALAVASATMLFRPDAKPWFAKDGTTVEPLA